MNIPGFPMFGFGGMNQLMGAQNLNMGGMVGMNPQLSGLQFNMMLL